MVRGHGGIRSTWFPSTSSINGHWTSPVPGVNSDCGAARLGTHILVGPYFQGGLGDWWRGPSAVAAAAAAGEGVRWGRGMEVAPCV